ncbi:putative transcriptional regulatory protein C1F7.11c [Favolaschia claudopus]|uniref:Transcriptional regulatory protein C1F7.11c n=1 Tax=Favolaschia claudopus TaxID=2862362 RepID=A0AAW0CU36_9AGAR
MAPSPYERPAAQDSDSDPALTSVKGKTVSKASKRIRGEIACAECRRLKIKCDRTVPCSTCLKRGCGALCPNGTIPPGEGSRFVLAATDHLHQKLVRMEARMHALEDALAILHDSDTPHPLLLPHDGADDDDSPAEDSMIKLKAVPEDSPSPEDTVLVEALGSLHIDGEGASRFFGPSGGAESLLLKAKNMQPPNGPSPLRELDPSYLPPELLQFCTSFPFPPPGIPRTAFPAIQETIETFLPPLERAIILCETFLEHLSWMFHIVSRRQLIDELIPVIYKQKQARYGPHELAVLLITLGIGALVDLNLHPYNFEAQHYYRLALAAVGLQSVMTEPSVVTIKTLHLMSIYNGLSGKESNMEASYGFLDMASQVALRTGLHVDPSMWRFEGQEAYERRIYFWNLLVAVLWQSVITGRPPTMLSVYVDCKIPTEAEEQEFGGDGPPTGLGVWGHNTTQECLLPIVRATLGVKTPSYEKIMELDAKIRNHAQPQANPRDERTAVSMKNFVRSHYRDLMLLFLHRAFFAQVMIEHATDPMKSPYAHSVLVTYASACNVLDDTVNQFTKNPLLVTRIWRIWSLAFSAAVVIGTLAIRGINMNLDPPPLEKFQLACDLFVKAAETSSRAARALPVLQRMLAKAYHARQQYGDTRVPVAAQDDEITIFGGRAEAIVRSPPSSPRMQHQDLSPQEKPNRQDTLRPSPVHPPSQAEIAIPAPPLSQFERGVLNGEYADTRMWEGLYREAGPAYGMQPEYVVDTGAMDDRWSSFMHGLDGRPSVHAGHA